MSDKIYDCIIIGAGPAGMTAAVYLGRTGKTVALLDKSGFGGNIAKSPRVENIPGFTEISGIDFATNLYTQATALPSVEHFIAEAQLLNYRYGLFQVSLEDNTILNGLSLIIATGTEFRTLNLPTNNLYTCVTCDGPFFKNKDVMVVGSGNTGATYALELATFFKNVYLCDVTLNMCCEKILQDKVLATSNIHWLPNSTVKSVTTTKAKNLTSVTLTNESVIDCKAIFMAIGLIPQTNIAKLFADLDSSGYIISNDCTVKKIPGVFVAGDCRTTPVKQVVTACADGATAALAAIKFLNNK